ncbi:unnamed protein product [Protopolystoma xenopodis]|uniref:IFT140 first beta-propeller domain-containing protein n=1 Tax=Protopolystoma xenopodis TaxID=117903 RepID=A0A448X6N2_9PLAT|nr:unnamed protein product [Protopolystoma xenopodis]
MMKLANGSCDSPTLLWAGDSTVAMALKETVVRFWDINQSDNYYLTPECCKTDRSAKITTIAFDNNSAAGLSNGIIAFWRRLDELSIAFDPSFDIPSKKHESLEVSAIKRALTPASNFAEDADPTIIWQALPHFELVHSQDIGLSSPASIKALSWNSKTGVLAASISNLYPSIVILTRHASFSHFGGSGNAIIQSGPHALVVITPKGNVSDSTAATLNSDIDLMSPSGAFSNIAIGGGTTSNILSSYELIERELVTKGQIHAAFCTKVINVSYLKHKNALAYATKMQF